MLLIEHVKLINKLLRSAYGEGRDYDASPSFYGFEDDADKLVDAGRVFRMKPVAVGCLHNDIVSLLYLYRISKNRPVHYAQVAGKYDFRCHVVLRYPYLRNS